MVSRYGVGRESRMFQVGVDAFQLNHRGGKGLLPKLLCSHNLLLCPSKAERKSGAQTFPYPLPHMLCFLPLSHSFPNWPAWQIQLPVT